VLGQAQATHDLASASDQSRQQIATDRLSGGLVDEYDDVERPQIGGAERQEAVCHGHRLAQLGYQRLTWPEDLEVASAGIAWVSPCGRCIAARVSRARARKWPSEKQAHGNVRYDCED
jgi:hypothetical protein